MPWVFSEARQLAAARRIFERMAAVVEIPFSVRLWDGTIIPLGRETRDEAYFAVSGPGVLGSLLRRPTLDNLFRHYVTGGIDIRGSDLITCMDVVRSIKKEGNVRLRDLRRGFPWTKAVPLLFAGQHRILVQHESNVDGSGSGPARDDKALVQFHYDASNDFYALFLDREMVYSCAYFTDWSNSLNQAQHDKLDIICRKLRLQPRERFLDIGCGWGALLCHAAQNYGVQAHGVTLSQAQHDYAKDKIERLGLRDQVTVALCDYMTLDGSYDKIASIGMYEHVRIANYERYFEKMRALLSEGGVFLNHGITRRNKRNVRKFGKISAGKRVILNYIFPGSELDHIGHTLQVMESSGFEIHDVEGMRLHYGRTCRLWHDRLVAHRDEAIASVGPELYRMWVAYLAGVTGAFDRGPLHVFQTVASKRTSDGASALPPTRDDLYRSAVPFEGDAALRQTVA
jgi:cyclopropane-fatty-acyl-phospholipid synthase